MTYAKHRVEMLLTTTDPRAFGSARRLVEASKSTRSTALAFGQSVVFHTAQKG